MPGSAHVWVAALVGLVAGIASGLLGVGGGIVMVPLLVGALGLTQHEAHATSLAAIIPIGIVGAAVFAQGGEVDVAAAIALATGALAGAPIGARLMARTKPRRLKLIFGLFQIAVAIQMLAT